MHATGGQAQHTVVGLDRLARQDLGFLHHPNSKTGQIVFAHRVHVGHLGCFSTNQSAVGHFTALGNALNDGARGLHIEFAAGEIIQKIKGLGALDQNVIDTHGHQINAHIGMHIPLKGEFEFGPDTIGAAHQNRLVVAAGDFKHGAKAANTGQDTFAHGFFGKRLDALDQVVSGLDVNAGGFVSER